jgi:hypothetical protein
MQARVTSKSLRWQYLTDRFPFMNHVMKPSRNGSFSNRSPMSRLMCLLLLPCKEYILNILVQRTSTRFLARPGFSTNPSTTALPEPFTLRLSAFQTLSTLLQQPDTDHFELVTARLLSRSSMLYLTPCFARQLFAGHNVLQAVRTVAISSILHQMGF